MSTEATSSSSNPTVFDTLFVDIENNPIRPGQLVEGTIIKVDEDKTQIESAAGQGIVPTQDLGPEAKVGDVSLYFVEERTVDGVIFSRKKAEALATWSRLEALIDARTAVSVTVLGESRTGLFVSLYGMKALLDTRDLDPGTAKDVSALKGQSLEVCVTRIVEKKSQIFVSQRALTQGDPEAMKAATLATLSEGSIVDGEVRRFAKFGAFVDIGGIDGLLHVKDISWRRMSHPSEGLNIGDVIQVKVLSFDLESEKISLGLKQMQPDPWLTAHETYAPGTVVEGNVVGLTDFGAFIMMPDGIEGLVHVSEMSWTEKVTKPSTVVQRNDTVKAWVIRCETDRRRLGLTLRDPADNPWLKLADRFSLGEKVKVPVVRVVDFGIFVALGEGLDGLIHVSDFSWAPINKAPSELYEVGQEIEAMVLEIDIERGRANLGIKHLSEDLTAELVGRYTVGDDLDVAVTSIQSYGVFAELEPGLEGLIHVSELGLEDNQSPEEHFKTGQTIRVTITAIDEVDRRISLSLAKGSSPQADSAVNDEAPATVQTLDQDLNEPEAQVAVVEEVGTSDTSETDVAVEIDSADGDVLPIPESAAQNDADTAEESLAAHGNENQEDTDEPDALELSSVPEVEVAQSATASNESTEEQAESTDEQAKE